MSNFKINFTLKQHTPIIHFQSDQAGATLRATELKPKLDRFLIRHAFGGEKEAYKAYLVDPQREALDYKVKILYEGDAPEALQYKTYLNPRKAGPYDRVGSYFGREKALYAPKGTVRVTFHSFSDRLLALIEEHFEGFLALNSFGSRQNKGFGSFLDERTDSLQKVTALLHRYGKNVYVKQSHDPLKQIQQDYQLLKSGRNKPYEKSLLFQYMCNGKVKWEKRMIKERMERQLPDTFSQLKWSHAPVGCANESSDYRFFYIRGLLGTAGQIEFLKRNPRNFKDKIKVQIVSQDPNIKRYRSPVTFKVFENTIYAFTEDQISIGGKTFVFKINDTQLGDPLEIPRNFDLEDFLDFGLCDNLAYEKVTP